MQVTIEDLKKHITGFVAQYSLAAEHEWVKAVNAFATFVEGKQAEADAIALLQGRGYTVTPPPAVGTTS